LRQAHRWRLWLLLIAQLPALALLIQGPWWAGLPAALWGGGSCLAGCDSDTPAINRLLLLLAAAWPLLAALRCC
jgi:hypothetical protein